MARLVFPVVSAGAEHLVMGYLMRRNILSYKAPERHEGYDLICIHPDPRHRPKRNELTQVRVQVKSRYASDSGRGFPVKKVSLTAFDFLVVVFLNIGEFRGSNDGSEGQYVPEFFTFPRAFIRRHIDTSTSWEKVVIKRMESRLAQYKNEAGFELIAKKLGIARPRKPK